MIEISNEKLYLTISSVLSTFTVNYNMKNMNSKTINNSKLTIRKHGIRKNYF